MRLAIAAALAVTLAVPSVAQERAEAGSGVVPGIRANSTPRPIGFAASVSPGGTLVVLTNRAGLPDLSAAGIAIGSPAWASLLAAVTAAKFEGKQNSVLALREIGGWARIVIVGGTLDANGVREAAGQAALEVKDAAGPVAIRTIAEPASAAIGFALGQYRFDRYKKEPRPSDLPGLTVLSSDAAAAEAYRTRGAALVEGVTLARDLSNEPANVIYPESFVARVQAALAGVANVKVEVLDEAAMRRLNMGSLLGVGQGSRRPSRLLAVSYTGGSGAPLAIVGKGITMDTGGISIKPGAGMWQMKADMSGAAAAMGTLLSLAKSRAPVNFLAVAALSENMPGGNAQRPGDVVRTYSGKTIEVLNTDAEGRLVMADATEYIADRYKPSAMVTIATLTGSAAAALDDEYAALFARDEPLEARIQAAAKASGEAVWRLPVHPSYAEDMKSDIADIKNVSEGGRPGAGLAAHFVQFFVPAGVAQAHLDIAGTFYEDKGTGSTPKGFAGWGVRLLDALARGEGR